jgi:hypothetical protein
LASIALIAGSSRAPIESAFIAIQVGRSTTIASGAPGGVCIREVSATGSYAARAASRIAPTSAAASSAEMLGPAGTRARPVVLAKSQST